mmetsp:Transcript_46567/g.107526  ORF Transcript_46567/g.107526 Transcript_46567/m.107526 type:complete len:204 (-) Transcript_46567:946-1557(-)
MTLAPHLHSIQSIITTAGITTLVLATACNNPQLTILTAGCTTRTLSNRTSATHRPPAKAMAPALMSERLSFSRGTMRTSVQVRLVMAHRHQPATAHRRPATVLCHTACPCLVTAHLRPAMAHLLAATPMHGGTHRGEIVTGSVATRVAARGKGETAGGRPVTPRSTPRAACSSGCNHTTGGRHCGWRALTHRGNWRVLPMLLC